MRPITLLLILSLAGCSGLTRETTPLDRQTFVAVYADLEATLWSSMRASADAIVLGHAADSVFADHHISRDQYLATIRWYNKDLVRWKGFFDDVGKKLEERSRDVPGKHTGGQ